MPTKQKTSRSVKTKKPTKKFNNKKSSKLSLRNTKRTRMIIFVALFAIVGTYALFISFATTNSFSFAGQLSPSVKSANYTISVPDTAAVDATLTWKTRIKANFTFKLHDASGNILAEANGVSPVSLHLTSVPKGSYMLMVSADVNKVTNFSINGSITTADSVPSPTPTPSDTTPPTAASGLKATASGLDTMALAWNPSNDNVGVSGYKVYRDGNLIKDVGNATSFSDSGLAQTTVYNYTVIAYDAVGNISPSSNIAPVITKTGAISPQPNYTLDSSFDYPSKSNPSDYRQHVDFNVVCKIVKSAQDDPIVLPGKPGASHMHVFTGNTSVNASSTLASLETGGTNCLLDRDKASYWMPELYNESGVAVTPYHARAYYRAGTLNTVTRLPHGLRIIAGDSHATAPQDKAIAGWQCRSVSPDIQTVPKQSTIPTCASSDLLEGSVVFPNCWDGMNLDSTDHKSHMAYGSGDICDTAHPVRLAQLTIAYRYKPGMTNSNSYLASMNSGLTLHADFFNAWNQPTLDALVERCINSGVHCGDVSPTHFPGPMP